MPTAYTTFEDEVKKLINPNREKALADSNAFYNSQITSTNKLYDAETEKAGKAYDDSYRENAVQKLINERQVAENMANLGLTNSGLNRTQQTAVQLSYANQKANLDRQRQSALDDINLTRSKAIDTIEQNRANSAMKINQEYDELINETAADNYKNYLDYLEEQNKTNQKADEKNSYIIKTKNGLLSRDYQGTLSENGVDTYAIDKNGVTYIRYVDNNSGKTVELKSGVNPYTGDDNTSQKTDMGKAYQAYGAYGNGYQPKGVYKNGSDYGEFKDVVGTYILNGNEQKVRRTTKGGVHLWVWDGGKNEYFEVVKKGTDSEGRIIWEEV